MAISKNLKICVGVFIICTVLHVITVSTNLANPFCPVKVQYYVIACLLSVPPVYLLLHDWHIERSRSIFPWCWQLRFALGASLFLISLMMVPGIAMAAVYHFHCKEVTSTWDKVVVWTVCCLLTLIPVIIITAIYYIGKRNIGGIGH